MLNAKKLLNYLSQLQADGNDLSKIAINYRYDYDSDIERCRFVSEDLFDEKTNSVLKSIVLTSKPE
jgi:hypothetical protein